MALVATAEGHEHLRSVGFTGEAGRRVQGDLRLADARHPDQYRRGAGRRCRQHGQQLGATGEVRLRRRDLGPDLDQSGRLMATGDHPVGASPRTGILVGDAERHDDVDEQIDIDSTTPGPEAVVHGGATDALDRWRCAAPGAMPADAFHDVSERRLASPRPHCAESRCEVVHRRGADGRRWLFPWRDRRFHVADSILPRRTMRGRPGQPGTADLTSARTVWRSVAADWSRPGSARGGSAVFSGTSTPWRRPRSRPRPC